jgi:hypothetical protein
MTFLRHRKLKDIGTWTWQSVHKGHITASMVCYLLIILASQLVNEAIYMVDILLNHRHLHSTKMWREPKYFIIYFLSYGQIFLFSSPLQGT